MTDWDAVEFMKDFDRCGPAPGAKGVEPGSNESDVAGTLAQRGYEITGVDLRNFNAHGILQPTSYEYVREDWNVWAPNQSQDSYDFGFSLSAIEHFGLGTYSEGPQNAYYDVIAMRNLWRLIKPGGLCFITVPYGDVYVNWGSDWRVYDVVSLHERIIQDFEVLSRRYFAAGEVKSKGGQAMAQGGDSLSEDEAHAANIYPPHVTCALVLRKVPVVRLAPDGR